MHLLKFWNLSKICLIKYFRDININFTNKSPWQSSWGDIDDETSLSPVMDRPIVRDDDRWMGMVHNIVLGYADMLHNVVENSSYITTLYKRWDVTTKTFHLPIDEWTMTLEDVW